MSREEQIKSKTNKEVTYKKLSNNLKRPSEWKEYEDICGKYNTPKGKNHKENKPTVTYSQQLKAYDFAQTNEKLIFMKLLKDLCNNIEQPEYNFGRPTLPLSDMVFSSAMKIYSTFSLRRFISDIKIARQMNLIDVAPCYASVGHFLQKKELTSILKELIQISATALSTVESDFAADASGFSTCRFARWFDHKWGKEIKQRVWIKAHIVCGVKTNIITSVQITKGNRHDTTQLQKLIEDTSKNFNIKEVSADKAYLSRKNFELIESVGAIPFIPFKTNIRGKRSGCAIWKKMYHFFMYRQEQFMEHYHKRSNVETVFHMIKTKFRDNLRSKTETAQINELLFKILCHNICVVIQEISELGIKGQFVVAEGVKVR
jgi:transposase